MTAASGRFFLEELRLHRLWLDAGGIEDVGVVSDPKLFLFVTEGRGGTHDSFTERQRGAIPMHALARRKNRPAHIGEAINEEIGIEIDRIVLRFVPSDEPGAILSG